MIWKSCGHRIATERSTTDIHQTTIRVLYELGMRGLAETSRSLQLNEEWAEGLSTNSSTPFSPRAEDHLPDETSGDIADQSTGASSCFQPGEYGQSSVTNRHRKSLQGDDVIRFMYICYPSPSGRYLSELTVRTKDNRPTDRVLIESLEKEYNSLCPYQVRLRTLRGFSTIRLARVGVIALLLSGADTNAC
jgi:hypothetical protein